MRTLRTQVRITRERIFSDSDSICVCGPFSEANNARYRKIGGWSQASHRWIFPLTRRAEIEEMFGADSKVVRVRVRADQCESHPKDLQVGGYIIATSYGRGRRVGFFGDLITGTVRSSGRSAKYPRVDASRDAVFEIAVRYDFAKRRGLKIVVAERGGRRCGR